MYGKVMGLESGFTIKNLKSTFKAGEQPDSALVEFDI
jgi:hypothetical protein